MPEKPPSPDSSELVDWERLRREPGFQKELLHALAHRILIKKFPDFLERSRERLSRLRKSGEHSTEDPVDVIQKEFEKTLHDQESVEDLRAICERESLAFPEGEELKKAEEEALESYRLSLAHDRGNSAASDEENTH